MKLRYVLRVKAIFAKFYSGANPFCFIRFEEKYCEFFSELSNMRRIKYMDEFFEQFMFNKNIIYEFSNHGYYYKDGKA